ncbi:unnamed protein product [Amaranthus hypochondriacus]
MSLKARVLKDNSRPTELTEASSSTIVTIESQFKVSKKIRFRDLPYISTEGKYGTICTIDALDVEYSWWYPSCIKCYTQVISGKGLLRCPKCMQNVKMAITRYKR